MSMNIIKKASVTPGHHSDVPKNEKFSEKTSLCETTAKDDEAKNGCDRSLSTTQYIYDKKWSWIALLGCFYIQCFTNYLTPCFGVFFSQKMRTYPYTPLIRSSLFTLHILIWDVGSIVSPTIVANLGHRGTSFIAINVASISFVLMAFVEGPEVMFIAFGIILAFSGGFLFNTTLLILPLYFEKYRRPASSFITAGMALSGVITPRLVRYLMDCYGYSGGLLLYGACLLQACVLVALFQPHRVLKLKPTESSECLASDKTLSTKNITELTDRWGCCSKRSHFTKIRATFLDNYRAMKNIRVLLMAVGQSFFHSSAFNSYAFLPFWMENHGYSRNFSAAWISNSSVMNLASRIFITFTVDHRWVHKRCFLVASTLISCGANIGFTLAVEHEDILTVLSFFYGLGIGMFFSIFYACLIDVVGIHLYSESLALNALFLALTDTLLSSFLGLIRDLSGSYMPALGACAVMKFCSAAIFAGLFYRERRSNTPSGHC